MLLHAAAHIASLTFITGKYKYGKYIPQALRFFVLKWKTTPISLFKNLLKIFNFCSDLNSLQPQREQFY